MLVKVKYKIGANKFATIKLNPVDVYYGLNPYNIDFEEKDITWYLEGLNKMQTSVFIKLEDIVRYEYQF